MGRVKGSITRRLAKEILARYRQLFSADFSTNKHTLVKMGLKLPKFELNRLAGEISVLVKRDEAKKKQPETA